MDWMLASLGIAVAVGLGLSKWWMWYLYIGLCFLWIYYALSTNQYGFLMSAGFCLLVGVANAYQSTKGRNNATAS